MTREYWIDIGYVGDDGFYNTYSREEVYRSYKEALSNYNAYKLRLKENEYVELWIVDWSDDEGMINQNVRFKYAKRGDK